MLADDVWVQADSTFNHLDPALREALTVGRPVAHERYPTQLELGFEPSEGPVWLRFGGGPGVKEFLGAAGFINASKR